MSTKKLVFDTSAIINFFNKEPDVPDLDSLMLESDCFVSVITRMELLKFPEITVEEEAEINEFLSALSILQINDAIEQETITISRKTKLKLPDAIIAATAITIGAKVVTTDPHFSKCEYPK
jgi:predicted nucleic acid-binding protein